MEQTTLKNEIDLINKRSRLSIWKFGDKKKILFSKIITQLFASDNVVASKSFLLAIVDHIIVKKSEIEVKGANIKLLNVVSETKMGTLNKVPIFVSMWR